MAVIKIGGELKIKALRIRTSVSSCFAVDNEARTLEVWGQHHTNAAMQLLSCLRDYSMRRKTAPPKMLSDNLLDQAGNLTTLELAHGNAMRGGTRTVLWSDGAVIESEAAAKDLGDIIKKRMPPRDVLDQLATVAKLPMDQGTALGEHLTQQSVI